MALIALWTYGLENGIWHLLPCRTYRLFARSDGSGIWLYGSGSDLYEWLRLYSSGADENGTYCSLDLVALTQLCGCDWRLALIALWAHWLFALVGMALDSALIASVGLIGSDSGFCVALWRLRHSLWHLKSLWLIL